MTDPQFWSNSRVAGISLALGFVANLAGVLMFFFRDGMPAQGLPG